MYFISIPFLDSELVYMLFNQDLVPMVSSIESQACEASHATDGIVDHTLPLSGTICFQPTDTTPWPQVDLLNKYIIVKVKW